MTTAVQAAPRRPAPLTAEEISARLVHYRKAKGLTQKALAELVDTFQPNIARWETGTDIPGSMIEHLCEALEITSDQLLLPEPTTKRRARKPAGE